MIAHHNDDVLVSMRAMVVIGALSSSVVRRIIWRESYGSWR